MSEGPKVGYDDPTRTRLPTADDAGPPPSAHLEAGERPLAPTQLRDPGRYDKQGEHGRGGIGRVFRARDKELGRDVALKELISRTPRGELRFFREALITARLEHPGIVPVHEAGRWPDGTPFYAMKLVAGRPLKQLIAERTTLEERLTLLRNVAAVADAIAYAHDRSIIHRDLKPSNIIVGDFGETVVIDWGLAKVIGETDDLDPAAMSPSSDSGVTVAGSVVGTPAYMAPEQARGEPVDRRADVYALGMILYDLCTGGPNVRDDAKALAITVDPDLLAIIARATDAEPARRYPDANALAQDLHAFLGGRRVRSRTYNLAELLSHWVRHNQRALIAAVAVVVLVVVVVGWSVRSSQIDGRLAREARAREIAARHTADAERDRTTLAQASELGEVDPTAAHALLVGLPRSPASALLLAEARGAQVATYTTTALPHRLTAVSAASNLSTITFATEARTVFVLDTATGAIVERAPSAQDPPPAPFRGGANVTAESGSWSVRGDHEGRIIVRNAAHGDEQTFRAHAGAIRWVGIDPSATRIATASDDSIRVWTLLPRAARTMANAPCTPDALVPHPARADTIAGRCLGGDVFILTLDAAADAIVPAPAAATTPPVWHGDALCWGTVDRTRVCADVSSRAAPRVAAMTDIVRALASDGRHLYVATENGEVLRMAEGAPAVPLARLDGEPSALAISRPGELVVTTRTGRVAFITLGDGRIEAAMAHEDVATGIAVGPAGDISISSWDRSVSRWRDRTFRARYTTSASVRQVQSISDGFAAVVGTAGLRVESTGLSLSLDVRRPIRALATTRRYACAATEAGDAILIDVDGRRIASVPLGGAITALAARDDAHFVASTAVGALVVIEPAVASFVELESHDARR